VGSLVRPLRLERRGWQWHAVFVERRHGSEAFRPGSEWVLIEELHTRLRSIEPARAAAGMRQLVRVHDVLRRRGWRAVEDLSARELKRAHAQLRLLTHLGDSHSMALLDEKLRLSLAGAEQREERQAARRAETQELSVEVSEADFADFRDTERSLLDAEAQKSATVTAPEPTAP